MLLCLFQWRTLPIFLTFSWGQRDHYFISLWFRKNKGLFAPVMIYPTLVVGSELFCLLWSFCLFSFSLPCALWGLNDKVEKKGLWNQIWAWILALPFMCLGSRVLKCTTSLSTLALIMYLEICIPQYHCEGQVSSVQFSSVTQSYPTLCDPMNHSTPGLPVHHQLPEFAQTHSHWVSDAIQPSHPLSSTFPPAPNPSQHQGLFQWVNSSHEVAKVLDFQLQHQSFQWTSRTDLL